VAAFDRNAWPRSIGLPGRNRRNPHRRREFYYDLGADSLDAVELAMAFEEEFGCEIAEAEAETLVTVGDAVKFFEENAKS
jgi:acyl carrier protein